MIYRTWCGADRMSIVWGSSLLLLIWFSASCVSRKGFGSTLETEQLGLPTRIEFRVGPVDGLANLALAPIEVAVLDQFGSTYVDNSIEITVALAANPGPGTLSGTRVAQTTAGVAVFSSLSVDTPATGYTLRASSPDLEPVISNLFDVDYALTVEPTYPVNGRNWLDYVRYDGPGDRFHQDDVAISSACDPASAATYLTNCIHGGEYKKVAVPQANTCDGMSASDDLGLFRWQCVLEPGPLVVFYSDGLLAGKGIRDTIEYAASPLAFKTNHVTVTRASGPVLTSEALIWWQNTIHEVAAAGLVGGTPNVLAGSGVNDIYVIVDHRTEDGYNLNADNIALVIREGRTLTYSGVNNSDAASEPSVSGPDGIGISIANQSFTWVEGDVALSVERKGVMVKDSFMSRLNNLSVVLPATASESAVTITNGQANHLTQVRATRGYRCFLFDTNWLSGRYLFGSHCRAGLMALQGTQIYFDGVTLSSTLQYETMSIRTQNTSLTNVLVLNSEIYGFNVQSNQTDLDSVVLTNVTAVDSRQDGWVIEGANGTTLQNVLVVNIGRNCATVHAESNTPAVNGTIVNLGCAQGSMGDVVFDATVPGATDFDFAFHGSLVTDSSCAPVGSAVATGITSTCLATGPSTASNATGIDPANVFVGALSVEDAENYSDDTLLTPDYHADLDHSHFEHWLRAWSPDVGRSTPTVQGRWDSGPGAIWDYRLRSGADARVFQRFAPALDGAACPAAVDGSESVTDQRGEVFLTNATEVMFDWVGDDDGLCESDEICLYTPNLGAYQGHGDYRSVTCVFNDNGGPVTGVVMKAYPNNGL